MLPVGLDETEVDARVASAIAAMIGQPNGIAGLDSNGDIVGTPVHRVDTAANLAAIVLKAGEVAIASDTRDILRGDGTTPGGILVMGGIRSYVLGPVELTSTTGQLAQTTTFRLVPGTHRCWGVAGFSGDTDNLSNFSIGVGPAVPNADVSQVMETGSGWGTFNWRFSQAQIFEPPTSLDWGPFVLANLAFFNAIPPALTFPTGKCVFEFYLPVATSVFKTFVIRLRTTKVGTPTIMGSYRLFVQRIA